MKSPSTYRTLMNTLLPAPRRSTLRRPSAGFTLIELMITVAIVAILAALAYPNYRNYVIRGQLVQGTNGLSALQANMERYYQDNRTYVAANGFTPPCSTATPIGTFTVSCPTAPVPGPPSAYQAQALGSGSTAGFVFTVDNFGNQATTVGAGAPASWIGGPYPCWITKQGGC